MTLSWQNAADDDLRRRPAESRRPGKLQPCQTVTSRPGWPSWNPPDAEPKASVAPVAPALHTNSAAHSVQTANGSSGHPWCRRTSSCSSPGDMKWTPGPASWQRQMTSIWRAVGAVVAGISHYDTRRTPAQTAPAGCRRWRRVYTPSSSPSIFQNSILVNYFMR